MQETGFLRALLIIKRGSGQKICNRCWPFFSCTWSPTRTVAETETHFIWRASWSLDCFCRYWGVLLIRVAYSIRKASPSRGANSASSLSQPVLSCTSPFRTWDSFRQLYWTSHCETQPLDSVFSSVPALDDRVHWMDVLLTFLPFHLVHNLGFPRKLYQRAIVILFISCASSIYINLTCAR